MIEKYQYGSMTIQGTRYPSDLIIYPDTIDPHWWREKRNKVSNEDVRDMVAGHPDYLIIGTGEAGYMDVSPEVREYLQARDIHLLYAPTQQASQMYNLIYPQHHQVIGAFHLTA